MKKIILFVLLKITEIASIVGFCLASWWLGELVGVKENIGMKWAMGVLIILMGILIIYVICVPIRIAIVWIIRYNWYLAQKLSEKL